MKPFNAVRKYGARVGGAVGSGLCLVGQASAAVPTEVTTAMTDMKADALVVAGAFLVAIIAIIAFKMMRKGA